MSESLDTLDERWKAGSFRYLMPDFRARVHRGETFVIAGDRFAIGSSREMSPAGLKGVAEEAGLEMVVVCGNNMGDIFRRNSFNLGLHVVQSPEAVADARDGDEFSFDPVTRQLRNETQDKTYEPVPLSPKEEEIRSSGGIFAVGRREFATSVKHGARSSTGPATGRRRNMTTTEQIIWAHRVDKDLKAGGSQAGHDAARLRGSAAGFGRHRALRDPHLQPDHRRRHHRSRARRPIANDHFVFTGVDADDKQTAIGREFARLHGIEKPYYATPGDGIFHFYFPEQGLVMPGQFIPGADSHSRAYGAYGAVGIGVGSTTLGFGWSTGYVYFTLAKQRRVIFRGRLQPWVSGKDIVLELLRRWGAKQSQGMSVELVDADRQLPMVYRNTIANMMAEAEALNGIFARGRHDLRVVSREGDDADLPYPRIAPGRERTFRDRRGVRSVRRAADDREAVQPRKRLSGRRGRTRADHVRQGDDRIVHQRQLRRSPAGRAGDPRGARARASQDVEREFAVFPGIGRRRPSDRASGSAAGWRVDRRGVPPGGSADSAILVRTVLRPGPRRARERGSGRSPRSTATGRTAWASAVRAISPVPPSSPRQRWSATWRRPASSGSNGSPTCMGFEPR